MYGWQNGEELRGYRFPKGMARDIQICVESNALNAGAVA